MSFILLIFRHQQVSIRISFALLFKKQSFKFNQTLIYKITKSSCQNVLEIFCSVQSQLATKNYSRHITEIIIEKTS